MPAARFSPLIVTRAGSLRWRNGDRRDPRRHRRGKQRRLTCGGRGGQERFEILGEPHVEHLVGFVEHQHAESVEVQRLAAQVIERAAGRGDDDVGAAAQRADLLIHRRAAVERHDRQDVRLRVLVDGLGHLHRQLARRHEHQPARARRTTGTRAAGEPVDHRQRKGGGLAGAGARLANQIAARQQERNRFPLDGRRLFVAERGHGLDESVAQAQRVEPNGASRIDRKRHLSILFFFFCPVPKTQTARLACRQPGPLRDLPDS